MPDWFCLNQTHFLLVVQPWWNYIISVCFAFHIGKIRIIVILLQKLTLSNLESGKSKFVVWYFLICLLLVRLKKKKSEIFLVLFPLQILGIYISKWFITAKSVMDLACSSSNLWCRRQMLYSNISRIKTSSKILSVM